MNLFIDTANWNLIFILEEDNVIIDHYFEDNLTRISDIALTRLQTFLAKHNLTIKDLKNLYITLGPGSYTGVRVAATIAKTLKTINDDYQIYTISSLKFQIGTKLGLSILDAKGGKSFVGIYTKNSTNELVVPNEQLIKLISEHENIVRDYQGLDFCANFLELKQDFHLVKTLDEIEPNYIKNFI